MSGYAVGQPYKYYSATNRNYIDTHVTAVNGDQIQVACKQNFFFRPEENIPQYDPGALVEVNGAPRRRREKDPLGTQGLPNGVRQPASYWVGSGLLAIQSQKAHLGVDFDIPDPDDTSCCGIPCPRIPSPCDPCYDYDDEEEEVRGEYSQLGPSDWSTGQQAGGLDVASAGAAMVTQQNLLKSVLGQEGLSFGQTFVYMVTAFIGDGVIVMPSLMRLGGWIATPVLSLFVAFAFMDMVGVMCDSLDKAEELSEAPMEQAAREGANYQGHKDANAKKCLNFDDLARVAMPSGLGVCLVRSITMPGLAARVLVFTLLIGENVAGLLQNMFPVWAVFLGCIPIFMILGTMSDSILAKIMSVGTICSLLTCANICIKALIDSSIWQSCPYLVEHRVPLVHRWTPESIPALGTVLACLFSAYSLMGVVPSVRGQMKNPRQYPLVFNTSIMFVFFVYLCIMLCSYWGYGNFVTNNVVTSLLYPPRTPCQEAAQNSAVLQLVHSRRLATMEGDVKSTASPLGMFMALLVTVDLSLSYSLFFKVFSGLASRLFGSDSIFAASGSCPNLSLRITFAVVAVLVAMLIPNSFLQVMALGAAIVTPCNNIWFPLLFSWNLGVEYSCPRRVGHCCVGLIGIMCLVLGVLHTVLTIVQGDTGHHGVPHPFANFTTTTSANALLSPTLQPTTWLPATTPLPAAGLITTTMVLPFGR